MTGEPELTAAPASPPEPSPAPTWPRVGAVLSGSLDLVTQTRIQIRNVSLYYGLLGVLTTGPVVLAFIAEAHNVDLETLEGISGWTLLAGLIAAMAVIAIGVESQLVATAILGGARVGRPVTLTEALRLARPRFWRFFWPTFGTGILVGIVSLVLSTILGGVFGSDSDAAPVGANLLAAVVRAPFIYLATGVVLGGVGWAEAISRSTRLARARFRLAVMAAIFDVVAQYLLVFAASAGADLAGRALEPFHHQLEGIDPADLSGFLLVSAAALVVLFAYFSLTFTIQALSSAPPVVSFIGLTGYTQGLDPYRDRLADQPALDRPARITRPMAVGVGIAWVAAVLAVQGALR